MIRFPIKSGYQYPRLTMKLPVKVRVARKKVAFFFFHRLVPPTGNMGGRKTKKREDGKKWFGPLSPTNFPAEGEVVNREGSQIGDLPLYNISPRGGRPVIRKMVLECYWMVYREWCFSIPAPTPGSAPDCTKNVPVRFFLLKVEWTPLIVLRRMLYVVTRR